MKYDEIIKLLDAGYSREEIMAMKEQPNDQSEEPEQEEKPEENTDQFAIVVGELKEAITSMKNEITAMNIMNSRISDETRTGDDIIADIINPPKYNRKEKEGK